MKLVSGSISVCVVCLLVVVSYGSCSTPFAGFDRLYGDTQRHVDGSIGTPAVNLLWTYFNDKGNVIARPLVLSDGSIVFATTSGYLNRVNNLGNLVWSQWLGSIRSSPAIDSSENIYVGSSDNKLYCLNNLGQMKWRFDTLAGIVGDVVFTSDGRVVVPSRDGKVYFLNANGGLLYSYDFGAEVRGSAAVLRDGAVVCGSLKGVLVAINANYTVRWTFDTQLPIASTPLVTDTLIVVSTRKNDHINGCVIALSMSGQLQWYFNTTVGSLEGQPVEGPDGRIYVGAADGRMYALQNDGSLSWRYVSGAANTAPDICRNSLVFASMNKFIYGLSLDGALLWKYQMLKGSASRPRCVNVPSNSTVTVYVGSNDQTLYALNHNF